MACVLVLIAVASAVAACGSSASPPQLATSMVFVPGKTFAKTTTSVAQGRVVIAYVKDGATEGQVRRLGLRVAALSEVEEFAYMSKDDCLNFFTQRFGDPPHSSPGPILPLPAGFWMLLHGAGQAPAVQEALAGDPALKHDDTLLSGVKPAREFYRWVSGM